MTNRILFVDDDERLLKGMTRQLDEFYDIDTACGPVRGLQKVQDDGPYAVVVSDMRMPAMTGVEFLEKVRQAEPETVRIILTGYADLASTVQAVNQGNVFRFLGKPVSHAELVTALDDGVRQFRLTRAEEELLEGTLRGTVEALSEVLSLTNPTAFGQAVRVRRLVGELARLLHVPNAWQLQIAALLSSLGHVTVPGCILDKVSAGAPLSPQEQTVHDGHFVAAGRVVGDIPRLEEVATMLEVRNLTAAEMLRAVTNEAVRQGALILKLAVDFDAVESALYDPPAALKELERSADDYDSASFEALRSMVSGRPVSAAKRVCIEELNDGMVLASDLTDSRNELLASRGQETTSLLRQRLVNYYTAGRIGAELEVHVVSPLSAHLSDDATEKRNELALNYSAD